MEKAVYYREKYFLLPKEFADAEDLKQVARSASEPLTIQVLVLLEDYRIPCNNLEKGICIAPYFLSGYLDLLSPVTIENPEELYAVSVEVLDQKSYNQRLREVINAYCPGCRGFKPLSNRDCSLNGHFEEISLNHVCFYRRETSHIPRILHNNLWMLGGWLYAIPDCLKNPDKMREALKSHLRINCSDLTLAESNQTELFIASYKKDRFVDLLIPVVSAYFRKYAKGKLDIRSANSDVVTTAEIRSWLQEASIEKFRKNCKRYGVSIALLSYDPDRTREVRTSLEPLVKDLYLFPLDAALGADWYLVLDTPLVLKALRYRSPMLETCHATVSIYGENDSKCYEISYDMKVTE